MSNKKTSGVVTTDDFSTRSSETSSTESQDQTTNTTGIPLSGTFPTAEDEIKAREDARKANAEALTEEQDSEDPAIAHRRRHLYGTLR